MARESLFPWDDPFDLVSRPPQETTMLRNLRVPALALVLAVLLLLDCGKSLAQTEVLAAPVAQDPRGLRSGFVVLHERYIAPPYHVTGQGPHAKINGLALEAASWRLTGEEDVLKAVDWRGEESAASRIRATLKVGGLVLVADHGQAACVMPPRSHAILEAMFESDADQEKKAQSIARQGLDWMDSARLIDLAGKLSASVELQARMAPILKANRERFERDQANHRAYVAVAGLLRTDAARYGVTVLAMALTVLGFGHLLNYPPKRHARWTDIDQRGDRVPMVTRNVTLLGCLSVFDLACTIAAQQAGGFLELNPFSQGDLAGSPLRMAVLKLTGVALTSVILLALRRYRGAQKASWWLCLVLVLLAFRWITYNSMFMV